MAGQMVLPSYLEPYVQRLYDARHKEFRLMDDEQLWRAVDEALATVFATREEIDTVIWKLRAKLRDDGLPPQLLQRETDDPLFR